MSLVLATTGAGVIDGGWEFIWAAYGITWLFFGTYSAWLFARARSVRSEEP